MPGLLSGPSISRLLDLAIVVTIVVSAYIGYRRGFTRTTWNLVSWAGAIVFALGFQQATSRILAPYFGLLGDSVKALSFLALVVFAQVVLTVAGNFVLDPLVDRVVTPRPRLATADHFLGPIPAVGRALVLSGGALAAIAVLPLGDEAHFYIAASFLGRPILSTASSVQLAFSAEQRTAPLYDIGEKLRNYP